MIFISFKARPALMLAFTQNLILNEPAGHIAKIIVVRVLIH